MATSGPGPAPGELAGKAEKRVSSELRFEAVTFDFWNTLVPETGDAVEVRKLLWTEALSEIGHEVTDEQLTTAFTYCWEQFEARWKANVQSDVVQVTNDAVASLGIDLTGAQIDHLAAVYLEATDLAPRELLPDTEETLDRLRGLGLRVGVICDVGTMPSDRLQRWLDELGVHHLFNHFSFSDVVGVYKPDPAIFRHALDGLGVTDPSRAAHVGDIGRTDIAGAQRVGMTGVRYTGHRDDPEPGPEPDHVIGNHLELLEALGLR